MNLPETIRGIVERVQDTATVKTAYGDHIEAEGRTIIPVARMRYGFGGGGGTGENPSDQDNDDTNSHDADAKLMTGSGGGGGGGVEVSPIGVVEITAEQTRFISFEDKRRMIRAGLFLLVLGLFLLKRRKSKT